MKKVLLVDDEADILKVVILRLASQGYQVSTAANGREAMDRIAADRPDLVILDYRMPVMDGLETCRRIKSAQETKDIPVIFMTASTSTEITPETIVTVQAEDFIRKPFEASELLEKVKKWVR